MKKSLIPIVCALVLFCHTVPAQAHFGMIIPSQPTVMESKDAKLRLDLKFWHPFANAGMNMEKPQAFRVFHNAKATDLLPALKEGQEQGFRVWSAEYTLARPGLYVFAVDPTPYFEKEEDSFIVHHTKVYVDAFGDSEGWDQPLGLKTEIVPLANPAALYAGNIFQGQVLVNGKPEPHAEVEVEWYPGPDKRGQAPYDSMITQTVKADGAGIFTYAAPVPGWWGFAALHAADYKLKHDGAEKDVEEGAVIWVRFHQMLPAVPLK